MTEIPTVSSDLLRLMNNPKHREEYRLINGDCFFDVFLRNRWYDMQDKIPVDLPRAKAFYD